MAVPTVKRLQYEYVCMYMCIWIKTLGNIVPGLGKYFNTNTNTWLVHDTNTNYTKYTSFKATSMFYKASHDSHIYYARVPNT